MHVLEHSIVVGYKTLCVMNAPMVQEVRSCKIQMHRQAVSLDCKHCVTCYVVTWSSVTCEVDTDIKLKYYLSGLLD